MLLCAVLHVLRFRVKLALVSNLKLSMFSLFWPHNTFHWESLQTSHFLNHSLIYYQLQFELECSTTGHGHWGKACKYKLFFVWEVEVCVCAMFKDQKEHATDRPSQSLIFCYFHSAENTTAGPPRLHCPFPTTNVRVWCPLPPLLFYGGLFLFTLASPWFKL